MPDEADDLILKMQHLEAAARASQEAHAKEGRFASLKSRAQQMAAGAQVEVEAAEKEQAEGEAKLARARTPGLAPLEAADLLLAGKAMAQEAKTRLVKARARLNFALDQMDAAERNEWEALQAAARAEAHTQLADSGDDSSRAPVLSGAGAAAAAGAMASTTAATIASTSTSTSTSTGTGTGTGTSSGTGGGGGGTGGA